VKALKVTKDRKKTTIEQEYRYRAEVGILEPIEDLMTGVEYGAEEDDRDVDDSRLAKKARLAVEESVRSDDGDSEWSDCEQSWELLGTEMVDINIKYERRKRLRLMSLSKTAERMERDYLCYRKKRDAELDAERMHER
jgi:hypothetical protein